MAFYNIQAKPSVQKDLRPLTKELVARIMTQIEGLESTPIPKNSVKLSTAERLYRIRVGNYRIVYEVDHDARLITIHYIRHRREVYRSLGSNKK